MKLHGRDMLGSGTEKRGITGETKLCYVHEHAKGDSYPDSLKKRRNARNVHAHARDVHLSKKI